MSISTAHHRHFDRPGGGSSNSVGGTVCEHNAVRHRSAGASNGNACTRRSRRDRAHRTSACVYMFLIVPTRPRRRNGNGVCQVCARPDGDGSVDAPVSSTLRLN